MADRLNQLQAPFIGHDQFHAVLQRKQFIIPEKLHALRIQHGTSGGKSVLPCIARNLELDRIADIICRNFHIQRFDKSPESRRIRIQEFPVGLHLFFHSGGDHGKCDFPVGFIPECGHIAKRLFFYKLHRHWDRFPFKFSLTGLLQGNFRSSNSWFPALFSSMYFCPLFSGLTYLAGHSFSRGYSGK